MSIYTKAKTEIELLALMIAAKQERWPAGTIKDGENIGGQFKPGDDSGVSQGIKEIGSQIAAIPEKLSQAKASMESALDWLKEQSEKFGEVLKKELNKQYNKHQKDIQKLTSKDFENYIQDKLIELKVLEERDIWEDLNNSQNLKEVEQALAKHQAEIATTGAVAAGAILSIALPHIGIAAGMALFETFVAEGTTISIAHIAKEVSMGVFLESITKFLIDKQAETLIEEGGDKKEIESVKGKLDLILAIVIPVLLHKPLAIRPNNKEWGQYWEAAAKAQKATYEDILKNHLNILGLDKIPTNAKDLRKAYLELAKKLHPDIGGDKEKFQAVQNAYEELLKIIEKNAKK